VGEAQGGVLVSGVWDWLTDPANWTGPSGVPTLLRQHLVISFWAMAIAVVVAVPLAVLCGHYGRGGGVLIAVGNVGRALPTYALVVILASTDAIGVGGLAVVLALAIFALPPMLVNTYVAVREVDPDVKDSARGMGMTGGQLLRRVELPLSFPLAFAGFRTATVQVLATATFGALVGAGTLGQIIVNGFSVQDYDEMYAGVVIVAVLCVTVDLVLAGVQRLVGRGTGRAARLARRPTAGLTAAADEAVAQADRDADREPAGTVGGPV
jgi:osmoprotectant transport system permease protein